MTHAEGAQAQILAFDQNGNPVQPPAYIVEDTLIEFRIHCHVSCAQVNYRDENPTFQTISSQYADRGFPYSYLVRGFAVSVADLATKFFAFAKDCEMEAHDLERFDEQAAALEVAEII